MTPIEATSRTARPTLVLAPGHWLGAWAWDEVAQHLRDRGHDVTALTLPGLDPDDPDRATRTLADQTGAVARAVTDAGAGGSPVVLVAHSGANAPTCAFLDAFPDAVRRVVYVDSGPVADGFVYAAGLPEDVDALPLPPFEELARQASLEGLDDEALRRFRSKAVPEPGPVLREALRLTDERRLGVPATIIACSYPAETMLAMAREGHPMMAETARLTALDVVDLPTGHWPMWSRPAELAEAISRAARS